ncbi:hypothetical protein LJC19_04635 [Oxalobacter sp. OttesenSCG-928-P03]|nr:hypothetical protein [Oxalobacter sp. OttesenSCG-928-P03]
MSKTGIKVHGAVEVTVTRPNGETETVKRDNLITNVGFDFLCEAIARQTGRPAVMNYIALGSGSRGASANDTALVSEVTRVLGTYGHVNGSKTFTLSATLPAQGVTGNFVEAGVFNKSGSGGTMLDRVTFSNISKGVHDTLTIQFTFTLS